MQPCRLGRIPIGHVIEPASLDGPHDDVFTLLTFDIYKKSMFLFTYLSIIVMYELGGIIMMDEFSIIMMDEFSIIIIDELSILEPGVFFSRYRAFMARFLVFTCSEALLKSYVDENLFKMIGLLLLLFEEGKIIWELPWSSLYRRLTEDTQYSCKTSQKSTIPSRCPMPIQCQMPLLWAFESSEESIHKMMPPSPKAASRSRSRSNSPLMELDLPSVLPFTARPRRAS